MLSYDYLISLKAVVGVVCNFYLIKNTSTSSSEIQEKQVSLEISSITD